MSDTVTVKLEEALLVPLKWFAGMNNLEIPEGTRSKEGYRAIIKTAFPELEEFEHPSDLPGYFEQEGNKTTERSPVVAIPLPTEQRQSNEDRSHHRFDPKVDIMIATTRDVRYPQDVSVIVNNDQWWLKRGVRLSIPYRVWLALDGSEEHVQKETDQLNPISGMMDREFLTQHMYPFNVLNMPSDDEIRDYHLRTDNVKFG